MRSEQNTLDWRRLPMRPAGLETHVEKRKNTMNITVYCGASLGHDEAYRQAAEAMGQWIAHSGNILVYGGGKAGLMGAVADSVLAAGGRAIGIMPVFLAERELAHTGLTELMLVETMAERKAQMLDLADACIALPGGPGTLEEISEAYSWARIGKNSAPCVFWNTGGFYEPQKAMYQAMADSGFLSREHFEKLLFTEDFAELEHFIRHYQAPEVRRY